MNYVRCVNNRAYIRFRDETSRENETTDLTLGKVYKAAPQTEDDQRLGELRVYDDTGEDYLFPIEYFEPYGRDPAEESPESLTIQVNSYLKNILRAESLATQKSMSALIRDWIDERLDLPTN